MKISIRKYFVSHESHNSCSQNSFKRYLNYLKVCNSNIKRYVYLQLWDIKGDYNDSRTMESVKYQSKLRFHLNTTDFQISMGNEIAYDDKV